ncbi:hypothetical protein ACO0LO_08570 [Undibacterium sp. TJN25]|uniref:hypothetical protein n=1 Tax=Undibacterium sp. TJN25 TaxID=3413056 RepID=UPI003BF14EBC
MQSIPSSLRLKPAENERIAGNLFLPEYFLAGNIEKAGICSQLMLQSKKADHDLCGSGQKQLLLSRLMLFSGLPASPGPLFAAICIVKKKIAALFVSALRQTFFRIIIKVTLDPGMRA